MDRSTRMGYVRQLYRTYRSAREIAKLLGASHMTILRDIKDLGLFREVFCERCGRAITRTPSKLKRSAHHYCSTACREVNRGHVDRDAVRKFYPLQETEAVAVDDQGEFHVFGAYADLRLLDDGGAAPCRLHGRWCHLHPPGGRGKAK